MITSKQIEFLARAIVNRLEDRGLVEFSDAEAGIDVVMRVLSDNFRSLETMIQEAKQRLVKSIGEREPTDEELESELRKIAAERSFVL